MSPAAQATETQTIPERSSLPMEDTWNLEAIYPTPEAWDADFQKLDQLLQPVLAHQGQLNSPQSLAALFEAEDALSLLPDTSASRQLLATTLEELRGLLSSV